MLTDAVPTLSIVRTTLLKVVPNPSTVLVNENLLAAWPTVLYQCESAAAATVAAAATGTTGAAAAAEISREEWQSTGVAAGFVVADVTGTGVTTGFAAATITGVALASANATGADVADAAVTGADFAGADVAGADANVAGVGVDASFGLIGLLTLTIVPSGFLTLTISNCGSCSSARGVRETPATVTSAPAAFLTSTRTEL